MDHEERRVSRLPKVAIIREAKQRRAARGLQCSLSGKVVRQPDIPATSRTPGITSICPNFQALTNRLVEAISLRAMWLLRVVRRRFLTLERAVGNHDAALLRRLSLTSP